MQRARSRWPTGAPPGWRAIEDPSWPLTVALYIRDVHALPATKPFFVPPMDPEVPEHIPGVGPVGDNALADEWAVWFDSLVRTRASIHAEAGLMLEGRTTSFRQAVGHQLDPAMAAAECFRDRDALDMRSGWKSDGPVLPQLVLTNRATRSDPAALRRLLGPIVRELA